MESVRKSLLWILLLLPSVPAAAYLECHQGAYSQICAEVGPPPSAGAPGNSSGAPGQTPGIPQTEDEQLRALIDSAEALLARGKFDLALREIEEALALRPDDAEAMTLRGRIRSRAGYADLPATPAVPDPSAVNFDSAPPASPPPVAAPAVGAPVADAPAPSPAAKPKPTVATVAPASVDPAPTSIVDARGQTVDLRLPVPEQMLNSPALGEWRKGMDAVLRRDWQLAAAWFKQGLNKDPANDALIRAAGLADWTFQQRQQEAAASGALRLIDQAFEVRDAGDRKRYDTILAEIRNDPHYQDPKARRWRDLVFARLEERSLAGGPKPYAQMSEEEKTELAAARLMGEALAEDCERIGNAALIANRVAEAKAAFQAAAALAPHIPYYQRAADAVGPTQ